MSELTDGDSSISSEEDNDQFQEAANCDYVNKLYTNSFNPQKAGNEPKSMIKSEDFVDDKTVTSHQLFVAKKLTKILDGTIKFIDGPITPDKSCQSLKGIRLFNNSVYIDDLEEVSVPRKRPKNSKVSTEKEYFARANEAAVSFDWVSSKANTFHWTSIKKPKLLHLKVEKMLPGDKMECVVVSVENIDKDFLQASEDY